MAVLQSSTEFLTCLGHLPNNDSVNDCRIAADLVDIKFSKMVNSLRQYRELLAPTIVLSDSPQVQRQSRAPSLNGTCTLNYQPLSTLHLLQ